MGQVLSNICQCKVFSSTDIKKQYTIQNNNLSEQDKEAQQLEKFDQDNQEWLQKIEPLWFNKKKLLSFYDNYESEQLKLNQIWKRIDLNELQNAEYQKIYNKALNQKWKYLIRKGVSYQKIRPLILDFFKRKYSENDLEYEINFEKVFGKQEAPQQFLKVPFFREESDLESVVILNWMEKIGVESAQHVLWILSQGNAQLEYSPMVIHVMMLLSLFLSKSEVYCVTKVMIQDSIHLLGDHQQRDKAMRQLGWYFTLKEVDFHKTSKLFFENVKLLSNTLHTIIIHFQNIGFDYNSFFQEIAMDFFQGYLPFSVIIRILPAYLNEGIIIIFRMTYALCFINKAVILNITDPSEVKQAIQSFSHNITPKQQDSLIKKGYGLKLKRVQKGFKDVQLSESVNMKLQLHKKQQFFYPRLQENSLIIRESLFEQLWEWLPNNQKINDPVLIWSTDKDGFSLKQFLRRVQGEDLTSYSMLMIIETVDNKVLGCYTNQTLHVSKSFYGNNECFLFTLQPQVHKYVTQQWEANIYVTHDVFSIGEGDNGPALEIDNCFNHGSSSPNNTFNNPCLHHNQYSTNFQVRNLEIYTLQ